MRTLISLVSWQQSGLFGRFLWFTGQKERKRKLQMDKRKRGCSCESGRKTRSSSTCQVGVRQILARTETRALFVVGADEFGSSS